jgi:hypothetical protein
MKLLCQIILIFLIIIEYPNLLDNIRHRCSTCRFKCKLFRNKNLCRRILVIFLLFDQLLNFFTCRFRSLKRQFLYRCRFNLLFLLKSWNCYFLHWLLLDFLNRSLIL